MTKMRKIFFTGSIIFNLMTLPRANSIETLQNQIAVSSVYLRQSLSKDQCVQITQQITQDRIDQLPDTNIQKLLQVIAFDCGISDEQPQLHDLAPVYVAFKESDFRLLWTGSYVSFNNKADADLEFIMPAQFNNKVIISIESELKKTKSSSEKSFVQMIATKLVAIKDHMQVIQHEGEYRLIISGYAYHNRKTYPDEMLQRLNEKAIGIGLEKVLKDENNIRESLAIMLIKDSLFKPQVNVSYEWQKGMQVRGNTSVFAGISTGFIFRDSFGYRPMPYLFPTAGLSIGKLDIKGVYIPKLSTINRGDVIFVFASVPVK